MRRDQLLDLGLTSSAISRRVAQGDLKKQLSGVYRVYEPRDRIETLKGALAALPGSVASHESAAMLHGFGDFSQSRCSVTVPRSATHRFPGVTVHRTDDLLPDHIRTVSQCIVTSLERTIFDLASRLRAPLVSRLVDDLVTAGRTKVSDLEQIVLEVGGRGKAGTAIMRDLILVRQAGPDPDATPLERIGLDLLVEAGIDGFEAQYSPAFQPAWRFDVAFPSRALAIEWDSRRWHTRVEDFDRDRNRDRVAAANGWLVLRFTMRDLNDKPDEMLDQVRKALDNRSVA